MAEETQALQTALAEVEAISEALGLPENVSTEAQMYIRQWSNMGRIQSRPLTVSAAAAVVVACKSNSLPFTTRDAASEASEEINPKYVGRCEKDMVRDIGVDIDITTPEDYVDRFVSEIGLDDEVAERTHELLNVAQEGDPMLFSGRSPSAGAAAAIWIAARLGGDRVTQTTVANVGESTEVTIRNMANSIILGVLRSGTDIEDMATTEEVDGRLGQRIEKTRKEFEAEAEAEA